MPPTLEKYRRPISLYLTDFLAETQTELTRINPWGKDALERLRIFALTGKILRGALVVFSYEMFGKQATPQIIQIAAGLELTHAALLIHDDIMDRDLLRRGKPSIFAQYENLARDKHFSQPLHFGESQGICVGNLALCLSQKILGTIQLPPQMKKTMLQLFNSEIAKVCIAQMQDMSFSRTDTIPSRDEILRLYRFKTARYTFSLPLVLGALVAGQPALVRQKLTELGEILGLLFQIKDDELNLHGKPQITGKPTGGDIRENKKTLALTYPAGALEREIKNWQKQAGLLINRLDVPVDSRQELFQLLNFILNRQK